VTVRFGLALIPAFSGTLCSPALGQAAAGLPPTSAWTLAYDDDSCALRRTFGDGKQNAYFELRRFGPDSALQTMVASDNLRSRDLVSFQYRWNVDHDWREAGRLKFTLDSGLGGVLFGAGFAELPGDLPDLPSRVLYVRSTDWRATELEAAGRINSIAVRGATARGMYRHELVLRLDGLDVALAALNTCIDNLVTLWDIDIEAHKTLSRPALPIDFEDSSRMIGYPPKMLRQAMPGLVNIRLAIDEEGRVTACRIQMPLSDPAFEASSCDDIQHAFEFEPALDKDGKPIASFWTTRVEFRIGR
jgi:hypothetical protein